MFSKRTMVVVGLIVLAAVCVTGLSVSARQRHISCGAGIVMFFVAPFQDVRTYSVCFARRIWTHYFFLVSAAQDNDRLRKQLKDAVRENHRCKETALSNLRLRKLLDFRESINEDVLAAEIVSKDPSPWFRSVIIDKGRTHGVKKGMPVVVPEGIAGLVTDVSYYYSKVLLSIDQNSAVDALLQKTRARGVIRGRSDRYVFEYVLSKYDVAKGDRVVSSGLDGVFPKGRCIGTVSDVSRSNSGIFQEITVTPSVDFETLEEVLIVLNLPSHPFFLHSLPKEETSSDSPQKTK
ncbi:rod shape-determining protein MreC [Desulfonema magnum]|uniref:Cell shape-determining protein MreC n=1 Tax=Desulfonema magnum TaxID=45655 RepID=A0A975BWS9_9BACT|nr:rod shape-determining protein MreC [Desulfonema magnum]QTA93214.1 Cell shape-determining protein [Desulfonema magnum]